LIFGLDWPREGGLQLTLPVLIGTDKLSVPRAPCPFRAFRSWVSLGWFEDRTITRVDCVELVTKIEVCRSRGRDRRSRKSPSSLAPAHDPAGMPALCRDFRAGISA